MIKKFFSTLALCSLLLAPVVSVSAESTVPPLTSGRLIKASGPAVFWFANDRRYVFPNEETFYSWFSPYDFARVLRIPDAQMAAIQIGGNVTYRPGSRLLKLTTDPRVYAVDNRGTLRPLDSEVIAEELYGPNWAQFIDDVPDAFMTNYHMGSLVRRPSDFRPTTSFTPTSDLLAR